MGMYTEIYVNVDLKPETPQNIIDVLEAICSDDFSSLQLENKPQRWNWLFDNESYYTPSTSCKKLTYDKIMKRYSLLGKGNIKNYEYEIEQFFDFIRPWAENDFMGYYRCEEDREPTLVFRNRIFVHDHTKYTIYD